MKMISEGSKPLIQPPDLNAFREWNRNNKSKALVDKTMSEREAVSTFINDGDYIGTELYGTVRAPMSIIREMIRQGLKDLRCAGQGVYELDLLAAAGMLKAIDWTYIGLEVYGLSSNLRRAVESGQIQEVVEWSNAAISWRFKAAAMGVPFVPARVMLGTDTFNYSSAKSVECPFTGETLCLLPALIVDAGLIHVSRADKYGNAQIDGISGFAAEMARASKRLIISTEEIVDEDVIRANPEKTIIPYYLVDAVVEAPFGSHPGEMTYAYERDEQHIKSYYNDSKSVNKTNDYLNKWIMGVRDHQEYLNLVGLEKLDSFTIKEDN
ncbi:MAG: CoA transferase subunit A [Candidatus Marinimicrobia bacterium]|jgi:acyl CoA:acetate/3-ketoacid CoA transferase alpha subunit|nr:CoA transferase subunit A [Candidatus Neomarinimicrobiota bacterium]MBT3635233.1 CoA transferase subunit A [Candidatus Neomarinimicrobiota bacterium]MBT3683979.1 CoA transferase subunit A [Candidatus Neomarinimicrobiota bacterium]MBT3760928.1 CoA transferase subunit A [Candidatus Neomarinimicrobiota bacterium]MBT3896994.1 CoA transferase subunit A [Candidatus Neomarinimicrobiota bacterium]